MTLRPGAPLRVLHALTIFLSAFLLFLVQPMIAKWILPWYGGGPAIWTTCLVFFQAMLFAGYAGAYAAEQFLPAGGRTALLLALIALALAVPLAPERPGGEGLPVASILQLLMIHVGLPFLVLSTTSPLVQAWHARAFPEGSPYRLYALSNAGSLAALICYPVLFEPAWGLHAQALLWTWGFRVLALLYAAGAVAAARTARAPASQPASGDPGVSAGRRALWVILPAGASWMLLASTNRLCEDLAVVPFLWVLPLAVYLLTFIVSFDHPRWYRPGWIAPLAAALTFGAAALHVVQTITPALTVLRLGVTIGSLFSVGMLLHGELARQKPPPGRLTGYYLAISAGGAIGGLGVSLAAPLVFSTFFEWKLAVAGAYLLAWIWIARIYAARLRAHRNLAAGLVVLAGVAFSFMLAFLGSGSNWLGSARNFYGVVGVAERGGGGEQEVRDLIHGRILHGRQFEHEPNRHKPTTYFGEESGVGRAIGYFGGREDLRVGVVGLGIGTIAAYGRAPTQSFRFYEINPEVVRMSRRYFTYLDDCKGRVEVVLGDARLSLEREPPGRFHVLALDAFSGDSIPTHLLTREAMGAYVRHLDPAGILAVHISSHYLDLGPVVRGMARDAGFSVVEIEHSVAEGGTDASSRWMLCTRSEEAGRVLGRAGVRDPGSREILWTDDASDLISILKMR